MPAARPDWERRRAELRRGLVRLLNLTGGMTVAQREAVRRATTLALWVERGVEDGAPLDALVRADRAAAKARDRVIALANPPAQLPTTDWLKGSHGHTR